VARKAWNLLGAGLAGLARKIAGLHGPLDGLCRRCHGANDKVREAARLELLPSGKHHFSCRCFIFWANHDLESYCRHQILTPKWLLEYYLKGKHFLSTTRATVEIRGILGGFARF
jgi:hypothetical protein